MGGGKRDLPDRPNLLRLVLGVPEPSEAKTEQSHVVVEANIDDMSGELTAHALSALMEAGALDAWAVDGMRAEGAGAVADRFFARAQIVARTMMIVGGLSGGGVYVESANSAQRAGWMPRGSRGASGCKSMRSR